MKHMNISKEALAYLIAGALTTLINFVVYYALIYLEIDYRIATTIAFIAAVLFAFISNKKFVFQSDKGYLGEFVKFMIGRGVTYLLDLGSMILLVEMLSIGEYFAKLWASILVVAANYLISKFWTFR
ncbi:MAG: GtrA family protein [Bacillota bacterium]